MSARNTDRHRRRHRNGTRRRHQGGTERLSRSKTTRVAIEDGLAVIYHRMRADDSFVHTAYLLFEIVRQTAARFPGIPRELVVDIEGHTGPFDGYDLEVMELLLEFIPSVLVPYLTRVTCHNESIQNQAGQREDLPAGITIEFRDDKDADEP